MPGGTAGGRPVSARGNAVVAPEPPGQVRLVGEAGVGRDLGRRGAPGQQPPRRPYPELTLIVTWREPVGLTEGAVGRVAAAPHRRGQVVRGQLAAAYLARAVLDELTDPRRHQPARPAPGWLASRGVPDQKPRRPGEPLVPL